MTERCDKNSRSIGGGSKNRPNGDGKRLKGGANRPNCLRGGGINLVKVI